MLDLNAFAREVHANAVEHGWWDEERSFGEIIALCHSELSEALEEYRAGRPMVWTKCKLDEIKAIGEGGCGVCKYCIANKPEGIAVELADCIIRILDWCGKEGVDIEAATRYGAKDADSIDGESFGENITVLHYALSFAYRFAARRLICLSAIIAAIYKWAEVNSIDMDAILRLKHEYNKTRPWRHNGKVI